VTTAPCEPDRVTRWALSARNVGVAGVVFGMLAFWLALPPVIARSGIWPVVAGILAVAAGIWCVTRGVSKLGWGAVVVGVLGILFGLLATRASEGNLKSVVVWGPLLANMFLWATPLTFAAIGGMFSERSGVVNIGLEGMMLSGAFFGILGADKLGSWELGLVCAMVSGGMLALIHAFMAIQLRADQIVSGTAINFLSLGVTGYFYIDVYGDNGTPGTGIPAIPNIHLGFLGKGFVGQVFGDLNLMVWLMFALIVVSHIVMFRTSIGLRIRAVGEHPRAADTVGISVYRVRYAAVTLSGVIASLGGAFLSIGYIHSFTENVTAGRGFIGLAALIFGNWRPFGAFAAALLFGFSTALQFRVGSVWGGVGTVVQALPYLLTLIAVAGVIGRSIPPAAIGRPYKKQ
jgi:general nucleoside transport system permease protein